MEKAKKWNVLIGYTTYVRFEVEAASEKEALKIASKLSENDANINKDDLISFAIRWPEADQVLDY